MSSSLSFRSHADSLEDSELAELLKTIAALSPDVRQEFPHRLKLGKENKNKYGEITAELDVWANDFIVKRLGETGLVNTIHSEELSKPLQCNADAPFHVSMDPLDGSSNIVSNNAFGTIVGIYRQPLPCKGREQVASLYKLYGPLTTLVYTAGRGVHEFVKHRKGEGKNAFFLLNEDMQLPEPGSVYGVGGDPLQWYDSFKKFVEDLVSVKKLKNRYSGAFVADFSQVLHYGGFFAYPGTKKAPQGKFRLFFEGHPMGMIVEQAGGRSSNGRISLLDVSADDVDARTPVYVGNRELIAELESLLKKELVH
ncbi:fructose-1,6-bisphosphatase [Candidatus Micrarchaeota archaeon]|nr:fructose-1,6-bisphosphatase [Candidatus Micrarchaeota archaeon]